MIQSDRRFLRMAGNERLPPLPHRGTALQNRLLFLKRSIDRDLIVSAQRRGSANPALYYLQSGIPLFNKAYGLEIEDKRTVYGECTYRLVPREDETQRVPDARLDLPANCLMSRIIYKICDIYENCTALQNF